MHLICYLFNTDFSVILKKIINKSDLVHLQQRCEAHLLVLISKTILLMVLSW